MSKVIPTKISKNEKTGMLNLLYLKISKLNSKNSVANFMNDLLTESEQIMVLRRLQIAKMLLEEKTYFEIRKKLGVGVDTIRSVRNKLGSGQGGFLNFIKDL